MLRCENVTHLHIHVCTLYAINSYKYMYIVFIHKLETDMKSLLFVNVICKYSHFLHLVIHEVCTTCLMCTRLCSFYHMTFQALKGSE